MWYQNVMFSLMLILLIDDSSLHNFMTVISTRRWGNSLFFSVLFCKQASTSQHYLYSGLQNSGVTLPVRKITITENLLCVTHVCTRCGHTSNPLLSCNGSPRLYGNFSDLCVKRVVCPRYCRRIKNIIVQQKQPWSLRVSDDGALWSVKVVVCTLYCISIQQILVSISGEVLCHSPNDFRLSYRRVICLSVYVSELSPAYGCRCLPFPILATSITGNTLSQAITCYFQPYFSCAGIGIIYQGTVSCSCVWLRS